MTGEEPDGDRLCPVCGSVLTGVYALPPELLGVEVWHPDPPKNPEPKESG